jgi:hypothetical protein
LKFQIPVLLLAAHFVADFIAQSDWMATNKSKRWDALTLHCGIYAAIVAVVMNWRFFGGGETLGASTLAQWLILTFATHFVTDALTSRATSALWFFKREDGIWAQAEYTQPKHGRTLVNPFSPIKGCRHWFFVMIGFDQLIHAVTLAATWGYLH